MPILSRLPIAAAATLAVLASCTALAPSTDYDRHRLSEITLPRDHGEVFYFDVAVDSAFPADDAEAEAVRMRWLDEWLKLRKMCPDGHEVLERRSFGFLEDNPAHRDLRYEVRCRPRAAAGTAATS
ncbi:MAG: hypothetical protein H3C57_04180 [Gammaproteobacteria bacterium]|nr:hypothetical protein [Gammaproteobacteria bacterium]